MRFISKGLLEMARKHSKSSKKRTHRQRRHRGGGWGFTGASSIPGTPGTVSNPMVYTGIGDCRATKPGYDIPVSQYGASMKGLPGMSGGKGKGKRKGTRKGKGRKTRKQRGGRYGFYPEGDPNTSGQAWWAGSYAPVQRIGCEGTTHNPLNPTHTGSSAPPGAASPNYWMKQQGGGQLAPATYGVGNVDSMYYYAPTAGYANQASTWKDSVGAPVQIQVPFAARSMNQACLSTGGHPPLTGALQKGGKWTRKQRGGLPSLTNIAQSLGLKGAFNTTSARAEELAANPNAPLVVKENVVMNVGNGNGKTNNMMAVKENVVMNVGNGNGKTNNMMAVEEEEDVVMNMGNGNAKKNAATMGGRRHKKSKSRKHRKAHKGRKH
jgi:hypothetical protein